MVRTKELDQFSKRSLPEELLLTVEDLLWLITRTVEGFDQMFVHHLNDTSFRVAESTSLARSIPHIHETRPWIASGSAFRWRGDTATAFHRPNCSVRTARWWPEEPRSFRRKTV
jgi:hypothetical protein